MQLDIETSVYALRNTLNTLKQEARHIEERLNLANEELAKATAAESLAKQCYHITRTSGRFQNEACCVRLAKASGVASLAISKSIMLMTERSNNLRAQNDLHAEIAELEQQQLQQTA